MKNQTKIPVYKVTDFARNKHECDFNFYRMERFFADSGHLAQVHKHDHFSFFLVTEGTGTHAVDFNNYELKKNRFFMLAPGQIHAWQNDVGLKGFVLLLTKDFFAITQHFRELQTFLLSNSANQNCYADLEEADAISVIQIFEKIDNELSGQQFYSTDIIRSYINIILLHLKRWYEELKPKPANYDLVNLKVLEFERLVNANFRLLRTPAEYAKLLKLNANYLNIICRTRREKSAGEIIRDRILLEAKRLLVHTDYSITDIAKDLNFPDNSYFARFFKKNGGQTASEFKELVRKSSAQFEKTNGDPKDSKILKAG